MRFRSALAALAGVALLAAACDRSPASAVAPVAPALVAAPAVVELAGQALHIDAWAYRDFMPVAGGGDGGGSPLYAGVIVHTADGAPVDAGTRIDALWVIYRGDAWKAPTLDELPTEGPMRTLTAVARGGPKWGPGVTVDIVIRLRDGAGHAVLLRAADRKIEAVY